MATDGKPGEKECCKTRVENTIRNGISGRGSEHDDGEELGDDDALDQGCLTFRLWRAGLISSLAWRATMQYRPLSRRCLNVNFNNVVICRAVS